jgi:hypothetical protein
MPLAFFLLLVAAAFGVQLVRSFRDVQIDRQGGIGVGPRATPRLFWTLVALQVLGAVTGASAAIIVAVL